MTGRQRISYAGKRALTYTLYYTGLLVLWKRIVMRRRAVVLMYHRVLEPGERDHAASHPALVVTRQTFERQMEALRRHFVVLSLEEFAERMAHGTPFPTASCVITFDDGWRDNFTNALPILKRYGLPALIFLPANFIGAQRVFWQEGLTRLLTLAVGRVRTQPDSRARLEALLSPLGLESLLSLDEANPRPAILQAVDLQKRTDRARVAALITDLAAELDVRLEDLARIDGFMTWEQVADMARHGVDFGGHGADHRLLTYISPEEAGAEIQTSKAMLEERFRDTTPTFSYPNGYFTPAIAETVKASGYRLAFTTHRGFVSSTDDPFTVHRLNIHESVTDTTPMFLARVVGIL
jgi:peptidoglycan/xylan/chitin deacetylase (PgdA/CDA1 family)